EPCKGRQRPQKWRGEACCPKWSTWNIRKIDSLNTDFSRQPSDRYCARATLLRREAHSRRASDRSLSIPPASSKAETQLGKLLSLRPRLELPFICAIWSRFFPAIKLLPPISTITRGRTP